MDVVVLVDEEFLIGEPHKPCSLADVEKVDDEKLVLLGDRADLDIRGTMLQRTRLRSGGCPKWWWTA